MAASGDVSGHQRFPWVPVRADPYLRRRPSAGFCRLRHGPPHDYMAAKARLPAASMSLKSYLGERFPKFYFWLLRMRSLASLPARGGLIEQYLASTASPKLQIGAGRNALAGW